MIKDARIWQLVVLLMLLVGGGLSGTTVQATNGADEITATTTRVLADANGVQTDDYTAPSGSMTTSNRIATLDLHRISDAADRRGTARSAVDPRVQAATVDATGSLTIVKAADPADGTDFAFTSDIPTRELGDISTVAGTGAFGFSGDGGSATNAQVWFPNGVAFDAMGNLFIADNRNHRIRKVAVGTGDISTVAGTGPVGFERGGFSGDGGPATSARLADPLDVAFDAMGNLFIVDFSNNRIRKVDAGTGIISTVAGTGAFGFSGDGGPATSAQLNNPGSVAVDSVGNLFIADTRNHRIRRVDLSTGDISTVAGTGASGFSGDGGPATSAQLNNPGSVAVDSVGNLFIADTWNHRIRKVDAGTGIISTVAGTGAFGFSGDGGLATNARLNFPGDVAVDSVGNLFIVDFSNNRIRKVDAGTGIITTVAGTGREGFSGDGGPATAAQLGLPSGVAVDSVGNLFIADTRNHRIRQVTALPASFSLDVDSNPTYEDRITFNDLPAGSYQITETLPAGWELDSATCTGGSDSGSLSGATLSVAVGAGEDVMCTFTNSQRGSLTIVKEADPADGTDFAFTSDVPGNASFSLDVDNDPTLAEQITFADLVVGTYAITERVPADWELDSASCSGGSDSGSLTGATLTVVLGAGEDVTCTFSNRLQTGSLTIVKEADPADGTDFAFTSDVPGNASFSLDVDNDPTLAEQITFADLVVGTYAITERVPAGWELDSASCSGGSDSGSLTGATLTVAVGAGEDVICTFSNRLQTGSLTIVKEADPVDGTDFAFTSDVPGNASFNLDVDSDPTLAEQITFADLVVGTYAITERVPAGWELDSASCTGGSDSGSLTGATLTVVLGAGEDVTCTFSNRLQTGNLTIVKAADPADGTDFAFTSDVPGNASFSLDVDSDPTLAEQITFADLVVGTYAITEVLPDGWQLDSASCTGGGDGGSLTGVTLAVVLGAGENVTCRFTNRRSSSPPTINTIYLPLIANATPGSPDLLIDDVIATTNTVTVTIRNAGTRPVVKAFWVDVYINPSEVPTLNTPWNFIAPQGVVWGIAANDVPLNPGETRVLTLDTARPGADFTSLPPYPAGATVYALVDSINLETTYGAVQERDEANNLVQSVITATSSTSESALPSATMQLPTLGDIPMRPSVP